MALYEVGWWWLWWMVGWLGGWVVGLSWADWRGVLSYAMVVMRLGSPLPTASERVDTFTLGTRWISTCGNRGRALTLTPPP